jgi:type II secretory pathway predicted ATPase ExeA
MNHKLLALYGLKWNPFSAEVPTEALYLSPKLENFCWRIEQAHLREGGFALIHGEPGSGKSVAMRVLAERLTRLADLSVGVIHHPQSSLSDFYRQLGDIFSIAIRVSNRWGGFKALRARWLDHLSSINRRPVILIDEAQEMSPAVLCELRLLAQARFDSQVSTVCGAGRRCAPAREAPSRRAHPLGQPHPHPLGHRSCHARGAPGMPRAHSRRRRQSDPDDQGAASHTV